MITATTAISGSIDVRFAATYVTGSHAFKTGFTAVSADSPSAGAPLSTSNTTSATWAGRRYMSRALLQSGRARAAGGTQLQRSRLKINAGVYAQDQWTIRKVTLNLGLRLDRLNAYTRRRRDRVALICQRSHFRR